MNMNKNDVMKHSQVKGAASGDNEPLFPRLHINETEKAGPRAPPRNKMALYEQLTVPSHRFVQRNGTTNISSHQENQVHYRSSDFRLPYPPYYIQPPLACGNSHNRAPLYARPAYGISSGDMSCDSTVVTEEEVQRVPRKHEQSTSFQVSKRMAEDIGISSIRCKSDKKAKVASDVGAPMVVPYSTVPGKKTPYIKPVSQQQKCHGNTDLVNLTSSFKEPSITNITGIVQETLGIVNVGPGYPMSESQCSGLPSTDQSEDNVISLTAECGMRQNVHGFLDEQDDSAGSLILPVQSYQQSTLVDEAQQPECQSTGEPEILNEYGNNVEYTDLKKGDENLLPSRTAATITVQGSLNENETLLIKQGISSYQEKGNGVESRNSVVDMVQNPHEISGESKSNSKADELSKSLDCEPSQLGVEKYSNSNDTLLSTSVSVPELTIKPKDVIRAIGQQQFWKARKALLRQQRVFSDQVFQLHKLIKVQLLLAETPGVFIDEEMEFGVLEESGESPYSDVVERANCSSEKEHNMASNLRDGGDSPFQEKEGNPEIVSNNMELPEATSNDGVLNPSMPTFGHGVVSAWGYPSIGMGQWMGPMDAQGRPFMYHPFSGPPFGGPYGSPMPGPIPPMVPFGIPYYGQTLPDMHQNYGSTTSSNKFDPSVGNNPMNKGIHGSWNYTPYGVYPPGVSKDVPTGSGASVNQSSIALPRTRISSVPGMHYRFGMDVHHTHQNKNSSLSLLQRPSKVKRSSYEHQDKKGLEPRGVQGSHSAKLQENDRSLGEEDSASNVPKDLHGKEDAQASVRNIMVGKGIEHPGWQLFPLVSLDGRDRAKKGKTEERQGQVIKAVPHPAISATQSAAGILLSLQRERQQ